MSTHHPSRKATPGSRRWPLASTAGRIRVLVLALAVMFSVAGARAVQVQVLDASAMAKQAAVQLQVTRDIVPLRGQILDRDGKVLAFTEATVDLVAHPNLIAVNGVPGTTKESDKEAGSKLPAVIASTVARYTGQDPAQLQAALSDASKKYVRLAAQVPVGTYDNIQADLKADKKNPLGWTVEKVSNPRRVYPMNNVASNVLGFMSEGRGGAGLELSFDSALAGTVGTEQYESSKNGKIPLGDQTLTPAVDGSTVTTTLDSALCWDTQQLIDRQRAARSLDWGFTVIMEVKTGKILCLANSPSFNGNEAGTSNPKTLGNPAMTAPFEPGSTMKVLTLASVLDAGGAGQDTVTHVGSSAEGIKSGEHTISDDHDHGEVDFTTRGILVTSSNQGTIQLARSTFGDKKKKYLDYLDSFGLGQSTDIGLPGENAGKVPSDLILNTGYALDSVAFGTSLTVNAVQMAAAVNGIMNNGVYVAPSILASTTAADGTVTAPTLAAPHRVVSSQTSQSMRSMMEQMVLDNYPTIGIPGYRTAAKTGTAQMGANNLVMSIVGVAPVEDPQLLVYTVFFQQNSRLGAGISTAGPVYHDIMSLALQRYGIQPSPNADKHCMLLPLVAGDKPQKKC